MNKPPLDFPPAIDLALEPPFRLGRFEVIPAALELRGPEETQKLELRVMQVLVALHQGQGQPVSRDDLSRRCWEGRIVGDDALNRSISRLRKALSADREIAIDTIPKLGYRLTSGGARNRAPDVARSWRPAATYAWFGLVFLAILAVVALVVIPSRHDEWVAEEMRPLTREAGVELFPALSPDGRQLAYAKGEGFGSPKDIFIRGISLGETRPLQLTKTRDDESAPAWSQDGDRLAFNRSRPGEPCAIIVMSTPNGREREVGRCIADAETSLAWLSRDELVFSDRSSAGSPRRLFAIHVGSGSRRPLTNPPAPMIGDSQPAMSPDGKFLAFRRTRTTGNDDVFLLDLSRGQESPLTGGGGWKALGFAWSRDSSALFLTTNREGDFGLWSLDPKGDREPRRVSLGLLRLGRMSQDSRGAVAVETSRSRANLFAVTSSGVMSALTTTTGDDWDPDMAADGSLLFGSDVNGRNEIWVKRPNEEPVRLTDFKGSYLYSPRWSPDGRMIAFIGVANRRADIYRMRSDGSALARLTRDGTEKGSLAWSADGSAILFTERGAGGWQVGRLMDRGGKQALGPAGRGMTVLRRAPGGELFGAREDGSIARLTLDPGGPLQARSLGIRVPDGIAWAATRSGIAWLGAGEDGSVALRLTGWDGRSRMIAPVAASHRPAIAAGADDSIITPRLLEDEADLVLLRIRTR